MRERPSLTAAKVARVLVYAGKTERYAPLLPEGAAALTERLLLAAGAMQPWMQRFYASKRNRAVLERIAEQLAAGQLARIALRKRWMDDEIRSALAAGATQVLVIGAGYDTACMRLAPRFPDRLFVEIDHPATQASKRVGVEALGANAPNFEMIAADLATTSLVEALARLDTATDRMWDPEALSIVIAEGLLMYLAPGHVEALFTAVHDLTGAGSRLAWTYMRCDPAGRPDLGTRLGHLTRWSLALIGEPIQWCVRDEHELAGFAARFGWRFEPDLERFDLAARYLAPAGLDDRDRARPFEFMALATRA